MLAHTVTTSATDARRTAGAAGSPGPAVARETPCCVAGTSPIITEAATISGFFRHRH